MPSLMSAARMPKVAAGKRSWAIRLLAGLLVAVANACSPYLHSPPARLVPLEAAKSLAKGDLAFQGAWAGAPRYGDLGTSPARSRHAMASVEDSRVRPRVAS